MLTAEVGHLRGIRMKIISRLHTYAAMIVVVAALTACATERALSPQPAVNRVASTAAPQMTDVPLLFVVDGIRLQRDQVPNLTGDQIASVQVIKGRAALRDYGPDASYGVVLIRTKAGAAPRS